MSDKPILKDERTTAMGLARYAFEYIESTLIVDDRTGVNLARDGDYPPIKADCSLRRLVSDV